MLNVISFVQPGNKLNFNVNEGFDDLLVEDNLIQSIYTESLSKQNRSTEGCSKLKRSVDMTSSGKNGLNIRTNASPEWAMICTMKENCFSFTYKKDATECTGYNVAKWYSLPGSATASQGWRHYSAKDAGRQGSLIWQWDTNMFSMPTDSDNHLR